jgi:hypothetical protein
MRKEKTMQTYEDMIDLEHPVSRNHERMSMISRAAQFSPFAAVVGYDGAVKETARLTKERIELDDTEKDLLDEKLRMVKQQEGGKEEITFLYFKPDESKSGGSYISKKGRVKKIDHFEYVVVMQDGTKIPIYEIIDITGDIFFSGENFYI